MSACARGALVGADLGMTNADLGVKVGSGPRLVPVAGSYDVADTCQSAKLGEAAIHGTQHPH
jgi:hypothetical protein